MPQAQLNALLAVAHQLPAIVEELRKANKLKALELKIRIENDYKHDESALDNIARIDNILKT